RFRRLLFFESGRKPERRTNAQATRHPDLASHEWDQLFRDCQSQSGAAILARSRAIRLRERLKQSSLRFRGDTDTGVLNLETQCSLRLCFVDRLHTNHNLTLLSKLDCVADQVSQHLTKSPGIASQGCGHS